MRSRGRYMNLTHCGGRLDGGVRATGATGPAGTMRPFSEAVFNDHRISGVGLAIGWDILQPTDGPIDWAPLDCTFAQADGPPQVRRSHAAPRLAHARLSNEDGRCNHFRKYWFDIEGHTDPGPAPGPGWGA